VISLLFERVLKENLGGTLIRRLRAINGGIHDTTNTAVYIEPHQIEAIDNRYNGGDGENFKVHRKNLDGTGKTEYFAHFEKDPDEIQYLIARCNDKYKSVIDRIISGIYGKKIEVSHERNYADRMLEATAIEPSASFFEHFDDELGALDLDYYKNDPGATIIQFCYDDASGASFSVGGSFRIFGRKFNYLKQAYNSIHLHQDDNRTRAIVVIDKNEVMKDVYTLNERGEFRNQDEKLLNLVMIRKIGPTEYCEAYITDWNVDEAPEYFA
jgi:hypothetical protein